jgi:hypothetical protein
MGWQAHRRLLMLRLRWHSSVCLAAHAHPAPAHPLDVTSPGASRAETARAASMTSGGPSVEVGLTIAR